MKMAISMVLAILLGFTWAFGQGFRTIQPFCSLTINNNSADDFILNQNYIIKSHDRFTISTNCVTNLVGTGNLLPNSGYQMQIGAGNREIVVTITGSTILQCIDKNKVSCFNFFGSNQLCVPCISPQ